MYVYTVHIHTVIQGIRHVCVPTPVNTFASTYMYMYIHYTCINPLPVYKYVIA